MYFLFSITPRMNGYNYHYTLNDLTIHLINDFVLLKAFKLTECCQ